MSTHHTVILLPETRATTNQPDRWDLPSPHRRGFALSIKHFKRIEGTIGKMNWTSQQIKNFLDTTCSSSKSPFVKKMNKKRSHSARQPHVLFYCPIIYAIKMRLITCSSRVNLTWNLKLTFIKLQSLPKHPPIYLSIHKIRCGGVHAWCILPQIRD